MLVHFKGLKKLMNYSKIQPIASAKKKKHRECLLICKSQVPHWRNFLQKQGHIKKILLCFILGNDFFSLEN